MSVFESEPAARRRSFSPSAEEMAPPRMRAAPSTFAGVMASPSSRAESTTAESGSR